MARARFALCLEQVQTQLRCSKSLKKSNSDSKIQISLFRHQIWTIGSWPPSFESKLKLNSMSCNCQWRNEYFTLRHEHPFSQHLFECCHERIGNVNGTSDSKFCLSRSISLQIFSRCRTTVVLWCSVTVPFSLWSLYFIKISSPLYASILIFMVYKTSK